jgi:ABC-type glutathione transport system ATPase component
MSEVPMQSRPIARTLTVGALAQDQQYTSELKVKLEAKHFNFFYGAFQALDDITLAIRERNITAIIGPSGCGKSTPNPPYCARSTACTIKPPARVAKASC